MKDWQFWLLMWSLWFSTSFTIGSYKDAPGISKIITVIMFWLCILETVIGVVYE